MKAELTQVRLKKLLHYDPETGVFTWKIKASTKTRVGSIAGTMNSKGYRRIGIDGRDYQAHRLAWFYMNGEWPNPGVDHRDLNPSNNSYANLRVANQSQNISNTNKRTTNTSGSKGVSIHKRTGKWRAQIGHLGKSIHIGLFGTKEEAIRAYNSMAVKLQEQFARIA